MPDAGNPLVAVPAAVGYHQQVDIGVRVRLAASPRAVEPERMKVVPQLIAEARREGLRRRWRLLDGADKRPLQPNERKLPPEVTGHANGYYPVVHGVTG